METANDQPQSINEALGLSDERAAQIIRTIEDTYNELTGREGGCMQAEIMQTINERINPQNMVEAYFVGYYFGHRLWMERFMPDEGDLVSNEDGAR